MERPIKRYWLHCQINLGKKVKSYIVELDTITDFDSGYNLSRANINVRLVWRSICQLQVGHSCEPICHGS